MPKMNSETTLEKIQYPKSFPENYPPGYPDNPIIRCLCNLYRCVGLTQKRIMLATVLTFVIPLPDI